MKLARHSKTIWFHIVSAIVAVSGVGSVYVGKLELTPFQTMFLAMIFMVLQTCGGIWLRTVTTKPLGNE